MELNLLTKYFAVVYILSANSFIPLGKIDSSSLRRNRFDALYRTVRLVRKCEKIYLYLQRTENMQLSGTNTVLLSDCIRLGYIDIRDILAKRIPARVSRLTLQRGVGPTFDTCLNEQLCLHQGLCKNTSDGGYRCACTVSFTGRNCETMNDLCRNESFFNYCLVRHASCENDPLNIYYGFKCNCHAGYKRESVTEVRCIDIDECSTVNNCSRGAGTCVNLNGNYMCKCHTGFSGSFCEENLQAKTGKVMDWQPWGHCMPNCYGDGSGVRFSYRQCATEGGCAAKQLHRIQHCNASEDDCFIPRTELPVILAVVNDTILQFVVRYRGSALRTPGSSLLCLFVMQIIILFT